MKKNIALALVFLLALVLFAGCGGGAEDAVRHGQERAEETVAEREQESAMPTGEPGSAAFSGGMIRVVTAPTIEVDNAYDFSEGLAVIARDGKRGYVNKYGEIVIPLIYDSVDYDIDYYNEPDPSGGRFHEGLAAVQKDGKFGYIDTDGNTVIPFAYMASGTFEDGRAYVSKDGISYGYIDKQGNEITPFIYEGAGYGTELLHFYSEGLARVRRPDGLFGFIDLNGNEVIPSKYVFALEFSEGWAFATTGDLFEYIDTSGEVVLRLDGYDRQVSSFENGLAVVQKDNKFGAVDKSGALVVPAVYDSMSNFEDNGLAIVEADNKFGAVDKSGELVIPTIYSGLDFFAKGVGVAYSANSKDVLIDTNGNVVFSNEEEYSFFDVPYNDGLSGLVIVRKDGKYGYMDASGKLIVPVIYDWATNFKEGLAWVELDGKWGVLEIEK